MSATPESTPRQSKVVPHPTGHLGTLWTADGSELSVRTYEAEHEVVLVVLTDLPEEFSGAEHEPATLEYASMRGIIRLQGEATFSDASFVRFRAEGTPEVIQRRAFVRVHASQEVRIGDGMLPPCDGHTVDISGGGMLVSGAAHLGIGDTVRFECRFGVDEEPIEGIARVVRVDANGRRALSFAAIQEDDRQRLIRFVFECMREARAKTRGDHF